MALAPIKISELQAVTPLSGTEVIPLNQGGVTKRTTAAEVAALGKDKTAVTGILKGSGTSVSAATPGVDYEPAKSVDDNFVTDAEKTKLSNLSGTNTGDQDLSNLSTISHRHFEQTITPDVVELQLTPVAPTNPGSVFYNAAERTMSLVMDDGGTLEVGKELFDHYTVLQAGGIVNGDIVSVVGASGNRSAVSKTDVTDDVKSLATIGMCTVTSVADNNSGRITTKGHVHELNTAAYAEGSVIYVDPANPGKWVQAKPAAPIRAIQIGTVVVSHTTQGVVDVDVKVYPRLGELVDTQFVNEADGEAVVWDAASQTWQNKVVGDVKATLFTKTRAFTGFVDSYNFNRPTIVNNAGTLEFTLTPISGTIDWLWRGIDHSAASISVTAAVAEGIWFIYSTDGATFELTQTPFDIEAGHLMVWEFYWSVASNTYIWDQPETHGAEMSGATHYHFHEGFGTRWTHGLHISGFTYDVYSDASTKIKLTNGELHDEDLDAHITHSATPTGVWEQILGDASLFAKLPIFYLSGATPIWLKTVATEFPFANGAGTTLYYNRDNAGTWDYTTPVATNGYANMWVVGTTHSSEPVILIPGRASHASRTLADAETLPFIGDIELSDGTLVTEYKVLYRLVYNANVGQANTGKCRLRAVIDMRKDATGNNASSVAGSSAALTSSQPYGKITAPNVQTAIEQLEDTKVYFKEVKVDVSTTSAVSPYVVTSQGETRVILTGAGLGPGYLVLPGLTGAHENAAILQTLPSDYKIEIDTSNTDGAWVCVADTTSARHTTRASGVTDAAQGNFFADKHHIVYEFYPDGDLGAYTGVTWSAAGDDGILLRNDETADGFGNPITPNTAGFLTRYTLSEAEYIRVASVEGWWSWTATPTPDDAVGRDGDYGLDSDGEVWKKVTGAWVDLGYNLNGGGTPSYLFEVDINGDMMPVTDLGATDQYYELDGSDDIMPKAA